MKTSNPAAALSLRKSPTFYLILRELKKASEASSESSCSLGAVVSRIAQKKQTEETYYVRARNGETYIIEYRGHQLTAHCREALGWDRDKDKLGRPMTHNECMYLSDKVGKHFSEDFIVRGDNELRYSQLLVLLFPLDCRTSAAGHLR
jgi:hypothetical protein